MEVVELLEEAQTIGLKVKVEGNQLVIRGPKSAEPIAKALLAYKSKVIALLSPPFINQRGELIIPFESDPKYHY